ncbi:Signal transduction histidine kinase [Parapedobacter luteus]|uniref:histidine kinase n=1 Tax=Parapedobacter luteus TaxID=623280 RepID=A0A1T5CUK1_9SPHI|nr:hybrid sensor histidine kinase/response regulator transcription factor [Parapedobacter luteus]SKB63013.1 Signal transduction histidine kinase [Parapedobacter luteus]
MMTARLLLLCWCFLCAAGLQAGTTAAVGGLPDPPVFRHLSFTDGLVQSPVSAMLQDRKGFIWIGNWKGLTRYDGYTFKNFRNGEGPDSTISRGRVTALHEDRQGRLWVATANGLNVYHPTTESFAYIGETHLKGGKNFISGIVEDAAGNFWASTFAGVFAVDDVAYRLRGKPLFEGTAYGLIVDRKHRLWVGTTHGVRLFDPASRRELPLPPALRHHPALRHAKVLLIREAADGTVWIGTEEDGLMHFQPQNDVVVDYNEHNSALTSNMIRDMLFDGAGRLWVGTRGGISVLDPKTGAFSNYTHDPENAHSLYDNSVWSLMRDRDGNLWVGTFSGGISYLTPNNANFQHIGGREGSNAGFHHRTVHAMVPDGPDGLWVATFGGGLHHLDRRTGRIRHYELPWDGRGLANQHIKSLAKDDVGRLWLGTLNGLFTFDPKSGGFEWFPLQISQGKLSARLINCILPLPEGVWVGANGDGLYFIPHDGKAIRHFQRHADGSGLSDNFVNALLADGKGGLWVATQNGLDHIHRSSGTVGRRFYKQAGNTLKNNNFHAITRDRHGRLWVGTEGGGMYFFDHRQGTFYPLDHSLGLTDDVVHTILEDRDGHLWVSTDDGLFQVRINRFDPPFAPGDLSVTHYTSQQGLAGDMYLPNAGFVAADGELYFGGINGLTHFAPDRIYRNSNPPRLVFTNLLVRNKPVMVDPQGGGPLTKSIAEIDHITLTHQQNYMAIQYAGINYLNPENNTYAYQLEGLDEPSVWHEVGQERMASYTNLAPGAYVFRVRAANSDGVWSAPASIGITVLPPLWKTWWAYLLYGTGFLVIASSTLWYIRSKELLRRDLHHEHRKLEFFTYISHEIRTPLTLITAPLERMVARGAGNPEVDGQLQLMSTNAHRLKKLVNELLDFRKIENGKLKLYYSEVTVSALLREVYGAFVGLCESKQVAVEWVDACPGLACWADADQLEKVFSNLMDNAIKFVNPGGKIAVRVGRRRVRGKDWVEVTVANQGRPVTDGERKLWFEPFWQSPKNERHAVGTGIGLALSKKIVELHHGAIDVQQRGGFTECIVRLPVNGHLVTDANRLPDGLVEAAKSHLNDRPDAGEPAGQLPAGHGKTVLVVDDHADMRAFLHSILSGQYRVVCAPDGEAGWEAVMGHMPDLIVTDVMMPRTDGLAFCDRVKTDARTDHIPVVLLTARTMDAHQLEGWQSGADGYLTKPFNPDLLELQVRNLLAAKDAQRRKYSAQLTLDPLGVTAATSEEKFIRRLLDIINAHLDDPAFGVPELASEVGMSKSVLYDKMRAVTSLSIANFIKTVRLQQAAERFRNGHHNIAETAFAVGFSDRKYFSREFRKQFGVSPSDFIADLAENP